MDDLVQELDEDVEGMQSTIFFLQQQLREKINITTASNSSSQSSEHLVTVNTSELCTLCRAAQEKKHLLNHANCSDEKVVKMEVDNSIDEENSRTQDSTNSSDNERTFQNGETDMYSPNRAEPIDHSSNKITDKRTTRASRHFTKQSVNLTAESTSENNTSSNKLVGLPVQSPPPQQCTNTSDTSNNSSKIKIKSNASLTENVTDGSDKASDEDDSLGSDNMVSLPPSAKRTKLSSGNSRSVDGGGQLLTSADSDQDVRTVGPVAPTTSRNRNGAVTADHS